MSRWALVVFCLGAAAAGAVAAPAGSRVVPAETVVAYPDGRPAAKYRLEAQDQGVVMRHGDGPGQCDILGARDVWVYQAGSTYYMHYDGAGPKGWLACLATSTDLVHWTKKGPVLDFGKPGEEDSASASYGTTYFDGKTWHMFYLGTPHVSPAPDLIPSFPYLTMKARSTSPAGPWIKQKDVVPFRTKPGTYYADTASPGQIIKAGGEYLQFFSASMKRTIGIARTRDLNGPWSIDPQPIFSPEEVGTSTPSSKTSCGMPRGPTRSGPPASWREATPACRTSRSAVTRFGLCPSRRGRRWPSRRRVSSAPTAPRSLTASRVPVSRWRRANWGAATSRG